MKIINLFLIMYFGLIPFVAFSQTGTIDYYGQEPPDNVPKIFSPGVISLNNRYEFNPVFSPDGKEFYFTVSNPPMWTYSKIMVSKYVNNEWAEPVVIDFGGNVLDWGNCFSPDGNIVYFNSCSENWILDIWYVNRTATGWSEAKKVSDTINSIGSGIAQSISNDSTLYFRSTYGNILGVGPGSDIFYSQRDTSGYNSYYQMDSPVNSNKDESGPVISKDGSFIIINTDRYNGNNNICVSFKKGDTSWTNPKVMIENAQSGSITPDNKYLLYNNFHNYGTNQTDVYWVKLEKYIDSLKNTNYDPYCKNVLPDQINTIGNSYTLTIPDSIFYDDDGSKTLTLTVTLSNGNVLPEFLRFDPGTNTISGKLIETGDYDIKIIATDIVGASVSDVFRLSVR